MRLRSHCAESVNLVWLAWQFEIEAVHQLIICQRLYTNRKASLKSSDPGDRPTIEQFSLGPAVMLEWQLPVITEDDAVPCVKVRQGTAATRVDRIQDAFKT